MTVTMTAVFAAFGVTAVILLIMAVWSKSQSTRSASTKRGGDRTIARSSAVRVDPPDLTHATVTPRIPLPHRVPEVNVAILDDPLARLRDQVRAREAVELRRGA